MRAIFILALILWQPAVAQVASLPLCTAVIQDTDNDGVGGTIDIDKDGDGLIELCDLEGIDEMRYQSDGTGYAVSTSTEKITAGCPGGGCRGYELVKSLDFTDVGSYRSGVINTAWTTGEGWLSIPNFFGTLEGNGYTISNLYINRPSRSTISLFSLISNNAEIKNIGLLDVDIQGSFIVGGLVGSNKGKITNSYVTGTVRKSGPSGGGLVAINGRNGEIISSFANVDVVGGSSGGGLAGNSVGLIRDSYALGRVTGEEFVGGLIDYHEGSILNSYAIGVVEGRNNVGGLVGSATDGAIITASYWDVDKSMQKTSAGGTSRTTVELQSPTAPGTTATEVYYNWNVRNWDFGDKQNYPALRYAAGPNGDACNTDITISSEVPQCGTLLPDQPGRDKGLAAVFFLADGKEAAVEFTPPFSPLAFEYDVIIADPNTADIQLRPFAINDNATIAITKQGDDAAQNYFADKANGALSDLIALDDQTTLRIVVTDSVAEDTVNTTYTLTILYPVGVSEVGLSAHRGRVMEDDDGTVLVDEGSIIEIETEISGSSDEYTWTQNPADAFTVIEQSISSITLQIPGDFVASDESTRNSVVTLAVSNAFSSAVYSKTLTIRKIDNGLPNIDFIGTSRKLTVSIRAGTDPDGDASAPEYQYQWQRLLPNSQSWETIETVTTGTATVSYGILAGTPIHTRFSVLVTLSDGQNYTDTTRVGNYLYRAGVVDDDRDGLRDIYTLEDLNAVRNNRNASYELRADLDFKDPLSYANTRNMDNWRANKGWEPIITFSGLLEGNGHTISNLYINRPNEFLIALFRNLLKSGRPVVEIKNVGLLDVNVQGRTAVGSLAGSNSDGKITNSYATGTVRGSSNVSGLVGASGASSVIISSFTEVDVTGESTVGGLVGNHQGSILNSYATGKVAGDNSIGGLVGNHQGSILNSYATGKVAGDNSIGGLVGTATDDAVITASYWDVDTSMQTASAGGTPRTTVELQSPTAPGATAMEVYYNWNIRNWDFGDNRNYPALRYADACNTDITASSEVSQCGALLPDQPGRDKGLAAVFFLADGKEAAMEFTPLFSSLAFAYDVIIADTNAADIQLRPFAINDNATIAITKQRDDPVRNYFADKASSALSDLIELDDQTTLRIVVTDGVAEDTVNTTYTFAITRSMPLEVSAITVNAQPPANADGTIDEGSDVTLSFDVTGGIGNYEYEVLIDEKSLALSEPSFMYNVAEDLLAADITTQNVVIQIIVRDGSFLSDYSEILTIRKINNGLPVIDFVGSTTTLTVSIRTGTDPDGDAPDPEYEYQWQRLLPAPGSQWETIESIATKIATVSYDVPANTPIHTRFSVLVTLTDRQNFTTTTRVGNYLYRGSDNDDNDNDLRDIYTLEDLDAIRNNLDASYELRTDLDFKDPLSYADTTNIDNWRANKGWVPLPNFSGTLEGNGHTISNLYINRPAEFTIGLFNDISDNAEVKNVGLLDVNVQGGNIVGGLAGRANGKITGSYATGTVEGEERQVGGLVGVSGTSGVIISSFTEVDVAGEVHVGGLVGLNRSLINHSYALGRVTGERTAGGLVGWDRGLIINSYASSAVNGNNDTGGLIGRAGSNDISIRNMVINSYAIGEVNGKDNTGGLIGRSSGGSITNSYAAGVVSGVSNVGGLIGTAADGAVITASYWDVDTSMQTASAGGTPRTTVELQSPTAPGATAMEVYYNWNVRNWDFGDSRNYPALRYAVGPNGDACNTDITTSSEVSQCGALLPDQPGRGKGLAAVFFLADGKEAAVEFTPLFSSLAFEYDVIIADPNTADIQLRTFAINDNATIAITKQGDDAAQNYFAGKANGALSDLIALDDQTTLRIVVTDSVAEDTVNTTYTIAITRLMPFEVSEVRLNAQPPANVDGTINEGSDVTLSVDVTGGRGNYEYVYFMEGERLTLLEPSFMYSVAEDFLAADVTTQNITFKIIVHDGALSSSSSIVITIRKIDNGNFDIALDVSPSRLSIRSVGSDPDGEGTFTYLWQKRGIGEEWATIDGATTATYWLPQGADGSIRYRVDVKHRDGQGYMSDYSKGALRKPFILMPIRADLDSDDDGLIEVYYLEDLDAIRHQLDGSGYQASADAMESTSGCAEGGDGACNGYELARSLDFNDAVSYTNIENKDEWHTLGKWQPIGQIKGSTFGSANPDIKEFESIFEGNGNTLSNLSINIRAIGGGETRGVGLFGYITRSAVVRNIGLLNVNIQNDGGSDINQRPRGAGGLVGINDGTVINSYVIGTVDGDIDGNPSLFREYLGGLVGNNLYKIINSYADVQIIGYRYVGGLVGENCHWHDGSCRITRATVSEGQIINSYANGILDSHNFSIPDSVDGNGGLVGANRYSISNSYTRVMPTSNSIGSKQYGGLVGSNHSRNGNGPTEPIITASHWQHPQPQPDPKIPDVRGDVFPGYSGVGRSAEELQAATMASSTSSSEVYYNWSSDDWDFGTAQQYPILRYAGQDAAACSETVPEHAIDPPQCGAFLKDQGIGLRSLSVSPLQSISLDPIFSSEQTMYAVVVESAVENLGLNVQAYDFDADIKVGNLDPVIGSIATTIPLNTDTTVLDIVVTDIETTTYTLTIHKIYPVGVSEVGISAHRGRVMEDNDGTVLVDEGSVVEIEVEVSGSGDEYTWTQTPADAFTVIEQSISAITLQIPNDFVASNVSTHNSVVMLAVSNPFSSAVYSKTLTIRKIDNGLPNIDFIGTSSKLTVSIRAGTDPDGDASAPKYQYQWQRLPPNSQSWETIETITTGTATVNYDVPADTPIHTRFSVLVTLSDGQNFTNTIRIGNYLYRAGVADDDGDGLIDIYTLEDLSAVRNNRNASYELRADLDFKDPLSYADTTNIDNWRANNDRTNKGWQPISSAFGFSGTLEGNGHTISNLYINRPNRSLISLFGLISNNAEIKNIGLLDVDIQGSSFVGSLAGSNNGKITNSYATGTVRSSLTGGGGLVALNSNGEIISSFANVDVVGSPSGGLAGAGGGRIRDSYALGRVTGGVAGGLVGNYQDSILNSYAIGEVEGRNNVGGLVGSATDDAVITASYWDVDTSMQKTSAGGTPRTTVELQSPTAPGTIATEVYYNWNVRNWDFGDKQNYPALRYATGPNGDACNTDITISSEVPQCGTLLPDQPGRDKGLAAVFFLADGKEAAVEFTSPFSPLAFEYDVITVLNINEVQLRPFAINNNATIAITKQGDAPVRNYFADKASGALSDLIALDDQTILRIVVTDSVAEDTVNTTYTLAIMRLMPLEISAITVNAQPPANADSTIDEGSDVTLLFDVTGGTGNYEYEALIDGQLLPLSEPSFMYNVAEDLLAANVTTQNVVIQIIVRDGSLLSDYSKTLTIRKIDNGEPTVTAAVDGSEIDISIEDDPDGEIETAGYVWQRRDINDEEWMDIVAAMSSNYSIPQTTSSSILYRVLVTYTDAQGYGTDMDNPIILGPYRVRGDMDDDNDGLIDIYYLEDLDAIRDQFADMPMTCGADSDQLCAGFALRRSLDFNEDSHYETMEIRSEWTTGSGWQPIGDIDNPFTSTFTAIPASLTISNLVINIPERDNVALFGVVGEINGGTGRLLDIHLRDANVSGRFAVGGLVGLANRSSRIVNSSVLGLVTATEAWVGGLVGSNYGAIINGYADGKVQGKSIVGGLAGYSFGPISNSYAHSNVLGRDYSGGLVGYNHNEKQFAGGGNIINSYASGSVESIFHVGGLVGYNDDGAITDAYALGNVIGNINVGGLIGSSGSSGTIVNVYAGGRVVGSGNVGDLVGSYDGMVVALATTPTLVYVAGPDSSGNAICGSELPTCGTVLPGQDHLGGAGALALKNLTLSAGVLDPPFDPTKTYYEILDILDDQTDVVVAAEANISDVSIAINAQAVSRATIPLNTIGTTVETGIKIVLTAMNQTTKQYTIVLPAQPMLSQPPTAPCSEDDIDRDDDGLIEICDIEGVYAIRYQMDGSGYTTSTNANKITAGCGDDGCRGYELVRDLDFNNAAHYRDSRNQAIWTVADYEDNTDQGWPSIGAFANLFNARFEGNGYTISNLAINRDDDYIGLFGAISSEAEINDVGLSDANVNGRFIVGGLVGWNNQGTITNSHISGSVVTASEAWIGGLVGDNSGFIANSYVDGIVSANRTVGGLVGINVGTISNSRAENKVTGRSFIGGLIGINVGEIRNSYTTERVDESIYYAGGLVGLNTGSIENSYATGTISGRERVGGLVGDNRNLVAYSYAIGTVSGSRLVGELVGINSGTITDSHATGSPKLTGFEFNNVGMTINSSIVSVGTHPRPEWSPSEWSFESGKYPALKYSGEDGECENPPPDTTVPNCGTLLSGQYPMLSLTTEAPATLFKTGDFTYLLRIAVGTNTVTLTPTVNDGNVVISYKVDDGSETATANSIPFTAALPENAQTITITIESSDESARSISYTIHIERFIFTHIKVFLEGLIQ